MFAVGVLISVGIIAAVFTLIHHLGVHVVGLDAASDDNVTFEFFAAMKEEVNMDLAKRFAWLIVGVVIGSFATTVLGDARVDQGSTQKRVRMTMVYSTEIPNATINQIGFIRDYRSNSCWIVVLRGDHGTGVAAAPQQACD